MPVVNYHSANGRLIGETTSGVRTDYMSDALGSVTGTLNASQAVVNTYRYKPYGELLAKTGSAADPAFMWNGTTQSRRTGLTFSDQYNRARHYGTKQGQWTTVDPLISFMAVLRMNPQALGRMRLYAFSHSGPTSYRDPSGLYPSNSNPSESNLDPSRSCLNGILKLDKILKHPIFEVLTPTVKFSICRSCFDCECPELCTATRCEKLAASFCVTLDAEGILPNISWATLLDVAKDYKDLANTIAGLITGTIGNGLVCALPSKACVDKKLTFGAEVAASFCHLGFDFFARGAYEYKMPCRGDGNWEGSFDFGVRFSNCGIFKFELCTGLFSESCT